VGPIGIRTSGEGLETSRYNGRSYRYV
jgi:hypothetical protein